MSDGIRALNEQELHNLAMNIVGRSLEEEGYEFMAVNSKLKKNPQFVCLKEGKLHFVVVRAVAYPNNPERFDIDLMGTIKEHAQKHNARAYYAGVGLINPEDYNAPVLLNQEYLVRYEGLVEV